jgi:hypothetical protein
MFERLREFWRRFLRGGRGQLSLAVTELGVVLSADGRERWHFAWADVTRIETYKRDLLTVDTICLDFCVGGRQLTYPTHDDMSGFDDLCGRLRDRFPRIAEDWLREVAFPAFETNHRVLYEKAGG